MTAALWSNNDKQGKEKKAERERERRREKKTEKREGEKGEGRMHGEDLWCLTTCGSQKTKPNPHSDTLAWLIGGSPPCYSALFLCLFCPTSVALGWSPAPGIAG